MDLVYLALKTRHLIFGFLIARGLLPPAGRLSVSQGPSLYKIDLFISVFNISHWLFHFAEFYDEAFRISSSHTHLLLRASPYKFCLTEEENCFSSRFQYLVICLHAQPCNTLVRTSPVFLNQAIMIGRFYFSRQWFHWKFWTDILM